VLLLLLLLLLWGPVSAASCRPHGRGACAQEWLLLLLQVQIQLPQQQVVLGVLWRDAWGGCASRCRCLCVGLAGYVLDEGGVHRYLKLVVMLLQ
jgi:hypothetical protein